jgi:hypothetical protein
MADYSVFGGCLRSELDLPELVTTQSERPDWELRRATNLPAFDANALVGEDVVYGDVRVRCYARRGGLRLVFDDTGDFEISRDGASIDWRPGPEASEDAARADVIGRVLALALHAAGVMTLHASAVTINGRGIVFVGPKHYGKSTLAMALVAGGASLVTDDTLPVEPGPPPAMRPGVHRVRLFTDSANQLHVPVRTGEGAKPLVDQLPPDRVQRTRAPIDAIYVLSPVLGEASAPLIERRKQSAIESAMSLVAHGKLAPLLRGAEAAQAFQHAAIVAGATAVYDLRVKRDLARIDEVVAQLQAWHA